MSQENQLSALRLEVGALKAVNYALQAGGISVVRSVSIFNDTAEALEHVDLNIRTEPAFCLPATVHFDRIGPNSVCRTGALELTMDGALLSGLTEKAAGLLHVTLEKDGNVLCAHSQELTALAFDQWHGYGYYPELLASFITPNHPALVPLTAKAAELLGSWTGDPSLDAYQTQDPNRVLTQAAAVYGALQEQNIVYAVPPASFETAGQRVRLCDTVLQQKMGTCLDLTLLYCGVLESMGLHPLLILQPGHIFAGVWLEELTFPESVQDDASLITKRLAGGVNEIAVVECTAFTAGKEMSFDQARDAARRHLTGAEDLEYIIDVRRSRLSGVTPLPQRILTDGGWEIVRPKVAAEDLTAAPQAAAMPLDISDAAPEEMTKKVQWERKLLDLGLRNNLISLRLRKNMVPILTASIDDLENNLSSGSDFTIHPRPTDYHTGDGLTFESVSDLQGQQELILSEFNNKRLRSAFTEGELTKALKDLYRASKVSLEENGANTLYLALGLLRWYETTKSTKARYAPLVLLPIEIVRKSARIGYVIRIRDEDPQMNVTLLEKLKQDHRITISGLDPLPTDDSGTDLRKVFTIVRKAVMNQARWDVLESAYLGIFSFSQFVMWNDIRNRSDDLERNKIVRSLMDGKLCWDAQDMTIGDKVPEDGVFLPMAADASQLFAIEKANEGESFVLHGPPGTGKSQTITTLIANALAQNKTVLFVAEKMAALEVVQRRLTKIGLGPFCLELHSNKSKKRDLLEQLRMATEVTKNTTAEEYAAKAERIAALRAELDGYADALHARQKCGMTLFDLINLYEENRGAPDIAPFAPDFAAKTTAQDLAAQETVAERLVAAAKSIDHPWGHPLDPVCCTEYNQQLRYAIPGAVDAYRHAIEELKEALTAFRVSRELPQDMTHAAISRDIGLARDLQFWLPLPNAWKEAAEPARYFGDVEQMARHYHNAAGIRNDLLQRWTPEFMTQDGKALAAEWDAATGKWFLPRFFGQNGLVRRLNTFAKSEINKDSLREQLTTLISYQEELAAANALFATYGSGLGNLYRHDDTDWQAVAVTAANARSSAEALQGSRTADTAAVNGLCDAWNRFRETRNALSSLLALSDDTAGTDYLTKQENLCDAIIANMSSLKDWIAWNAVAEEAANLGLGNLVDSYRCGAGHDDILPAYRKAASLALAMAAIDADKSLRTFSGAVFNEKVRQFKRMDEELAKLTQQEIYCRLAAKVPNFTKEAAHSSELGILQRAIRSGGRGVSIRKLFEQIPNLLPRLCPCMLMSPISAAQYLDPKREPFHMVVFDEASQLPTCKAVGALARGENAVVVGDPKQMPPTAFFATNTVDEENLDTEDLESILDDCLALNIPQTHLLWHYRSRHESLIAFSNSRFYENKLYTFPSVNDRERKVRMIHVDGVFERGKNRQNKAEAQAVIEELKRRCHDPELSKLSVGVVTFNINQQNLIDDLLSEACREDTALEAWAYQSAEPLFIKNLENVQGDERDVILFSVGYGPDEKGKVYMNFGPLNRDGGWRRLNVAITRSRQEMIVFATLKPEQIDLGRTTAEGVSALKAFLEYADRGILPQTAGDAKQRQAEGISEAICSFLEKKGYRTDCHVGHSEYRIDIGVIDPENPDRYMLGILLDGDTYGAAKTTRDREMAQISVLEGLGWRIHRVWTMDWWDNARAELDRILEVLQTPPSEPEEAAPETAVVPETAPKLASNAQPVEKPVYPVYTPAKLRQVEVAAEDFLLPRYTAGIRKKIEAAIAAEAPISKNLLIRRVVQSYGITRAGSRIQSHMEAILDDMSLLTTSLDDQVFFWRADQDPVAYTEFRTADKDENRREPKDIPVQEAANAVHQVLADQISMASEDLIRESAKLLGFSRLGSAVTPLLTAAITYAATHGTIATGPNGNYVIADPQS